MKNNDVGRLAAKSKNCKDCGTAFVLTEGDMKFYKEKNWQEPERCLPCRRKSRDRNAKAK